MAVRSFRVLFVLLCTIVTPMSAQAQPRPGGPGMGPPVGMIPPIAGVAFKLEQGAWAEYTIQQGQMQASMKLAVVGKETCGNKQCTWLEITMRMQGGAMSMKMLVDGDPRNQKNIKRMLMRMPDGSVQEIPMMAMQMGTGMGHRHGQGHKTMTKPGAKMEDAPQFKELGKERVKTGAGTYEARHFLARKGDKEMHAWVSDNVKLFHLVKLNSPFVKMELVGQGTGAKPSF